MGKGGDPAQTPPPGWASGEAKRRLFPPVESRHRVPPSAPWTGKDGLNSQTLRQHSPHLGPKGHTSRNQQRACVENYTGARCGEILLASIKSHSRGELFAAVLASVVVLSVLVAGAFFFLYRRGQISRTSSAERGESLIEGDNSVPPQKITE
ncbi:pro-neuregulin-4, membrane-bound isoform isoform X1 [Anolis sagrei]|uniref:pro-neuregulin-4, membrane-bound isoform isoform X1 n=1 Tax=Anolis sagrei TaxID=38937 RepID=UPI0035211201